MSSFCVSTYPDFLLSLYLLLFNCIHFLALSSKTLSLSSSLIGILYEGCGKGMEVPGGAMTEAGEGTAPPATVHISFDPGAPPPAALFHISNYSAKLNRTGFEAGDIWLSYSRKDSSTRISRVYWRIDGVSVFQYSGLISRTKKFDEKTTVGIYKKGSSWVGP